MTLETGIRHIVETEMEKAADLWRNKLKYANQERDKYQKGWEEEKKLTEQLKADIESYKNLLKQSLEIIEGWKRLFKDFKALKETNQ